MQISLDGFVAGPNGEMNWIKVDEEIFDHVGKRIGEGDTAFSEHGLRGLHCPPLAGEVLRYKCIYKLGVDI